MRAGAERIVFGTAAVKDPGLIAEALAMDAAAVVVALDVRNGLIQTEGWLEAAEISLLELAVQMEALGVRRVLSTDIMRDGTLSEPNFSGLAQLRQATAMAVQASGGISSVEQLLRLAADGMEGAIVGRALYTGDLDLSEALATLHANGGPKPSFDQDAGATK